MSRISYAGTAALLALIASLQVVRLQYEEPPRPAPAPVRVRMLFAGDVMQHGPQVQAARRGSGFDYAPVFEWIRPRFEEADLTVVNLETTLTRSDNYTGYPCFRSPVALARALRQAGVDVALLSNNHCCDGGLAGIRTTAEMLDSCGIGRTGVYTDSIDRAMRHPLLVTRRHITIGILNYTYGTNGLPVPVPAVVEQIDTTRMKEDVAEARRRGAHCVVVCVHWGEEYERRPNATQKKVAGLLFRSGADVIIGSHPHVVQPYEADSTHVLFWSLGNFVSNQRKRYCDGGIMAEVTLIAEPDGRIRFESQAVPVWVQLPEYRIVPPEVADTMQMPAACRTFLSDVTEMAAPQHTEHFP